jgi:hypothetical protein
VVERREMCMCVGWEHLNVRIRLEDLGIDGRIILKKLLNMADDCGLVLSAT